MAEAGAQCKAPKALKEPLPSCCCPERGGHTILSSPGARWPGTGFSLAREGRKCQCWLKSTLRSSKRPAGRVQLSCCPATPRPKLCMDKLSPTPKKKSGRSWHQERPRPRGASVAQHRALPKPLALRAVPAGCGGSGRPRSALCFHCSHLRFYSLQLTSGEILPRRN